jgi:putative oxidoreductase
MLLSLSFLNKFEDHALLLLRLGVGGLIAFHGYPLFLGGTSRWAELGGAVAPIGLTSFPAFWGFLAAASQFFGGLFVVLGLGTRISALFIATTMTVAAATHLTGGDGLVGGTPAVTFAVVFWAMVLLGPGRFSVDAKLS